MNMRNEEKHKERVRNLIRDMRKDLRKKAGTPSFNHTKELYLDALVNNNHVVSMAEARRKLAI